MTIEQSNGTNPIFPPKMIADFAKLPIQKEVMELEYQLEILMNRDVLTDYDRKLRDYIHNRCNKIWKKIHNSSHRVFMSTKPTRNLKKD